MCNTQIIECSSALKNKVLVGLCAAAALLFCTVPVFAAGSGLSVAGSAGAGKPIIMLTPTISDAELAKLGDNDVVELQSGRQVKMKTIRTFSSLSRKLKAGRSTQPAMPTSIKKPAATGIKMTSRADLSSMLESSPDDTTIEFSSGRTYTIAQLRFLKPFLEAQTGRKLDQQGGPSRYQGPAIKLTNTKDKKYWESILSKPDDTVLETPQGKRFTIGELKTVIGQGQLSRLSSADTNGGGK